MLSGLRVLDLTNEKGFLCGKILAELGADVIKIEKPGGDYSRNIGPFYHNSIDPEKSLYWFAYNSSKRGITLNIEDEQGREIFKRLVSRSDILIESFSPGYLDNMGLGYAELSKLNPRIILASITPFGQTGQVKNCEASDLTLMAMSGIMHISGFRDKPPVRPGFNQSYCLVGIQTAIGILFALYHRRISGTGQHIDASIYECLAVANYQEPLWWEIDKVITGRADGRWVRGLSSTRQIWQCKDGYICWVLLGGEHEIKLLRNMIKKMDEEGLADFLKSIDLDEIHISQLPDGEIRRWEDVIANFFIRHTKEELQKLSIELGLRLSIINDISDIAASEQLGSRGYWENVAYPELGTHIKSPGFLFLGSETPSRVRFRAPLIGEHNRDIYEKEIGFSEQELAHLKNINVI